MRKELTVFGATFEKGEEFSLASLSIDRSFVVLNSSTGKFTAKVSDLEEALKAIKEFNASNNTKVEDKPELPKYEEIEYGE